MLVVDTSELKRPTQRRLHAAWREVHGQKVLATPMVASELAPLSADSLGTGDPSVAETLLETRAGSLTPRRKSELDQQAWWAQMWRDPESPYRIVPLTAEQASLAERVCEQIDPRCFPNTDPDDIPDLADARIIAESLAVDAKMLLTSNLQSIDHVEVNRWAVDNGEAYGFKPERVLFQADVTLIEWTTEPDKLDRWIQAGLLACWPGRDEADARDIIESTLTTIGSMMRGTGGKLPMAGGRLLNGLKKHDDPIGLVERTRELLPSATVDSDRTHPSYPHRPGSGQLPGGGNRAEPSTGIAH